MGGMNETVNLTLHIYTCVLVIQLSSFLWPSLASVMKKLNAFRKSIKYVFSMILSKHSELNN